MWRSRAPRVLAATGLVLALLAALPVTFGIAVLVTAAVSGWRDPGPDIVQGCETSLLCAEFGTFLALWGFFVLAYIGACLFVFRRLHVRR